jgi:RimJ/RimL family protein N-acetyltransferase
MDYGPWAMGRAQNQTNQHNLLIFQTQRLTVRRYTMDDAGDFFRFSGDEQVMRYIRPAIGRQESDKFLAENIQMYQTYPNAGRWAVLQKFTGHYVGSFSILVMDADSSQMHIGYALLPQYWGLGYATELLKTGIQYFFNKHKADELFAITQIPNTQSQNVLLKAGFTHLGVLPRQHDAWLYRLTRQQATHNE